MQLIKLVTIESTADANFWPYAIGPLSVCLSCLWRWCTVAKRLHGSRWNLACR